MMLALLWLFAILAAYYVTHKPFATSNLAAMGQAAAGLAGASLMMASGTGMGLLLLQHIELTPVERLIWAAALGLGAIALAGLGLGAAGLLKPWLLWLLTIIGLAVVSRPLVYALLAARDDIAWRPASRFEQFLAIYCGITLAGALVWSLTPPTAWDGLVYHLAEPRLYLHSGRISHPFDLPYLGFPQLIEMLFAWGMGLTGERTAAPIHWFYGALTVPTLVTAGRRWLSSAAGWLAAAMLLSASSIVLLAGWPYVDLALLLYSTLAWLSLMRWSESEPKERKWLVIGGAMAGLALATKYTALALLPALGVVVLILPISDLKTRLANLMILSSAALVVWSPWLLKNLALTGNPVYPFFFGGVHWDNWRAWWYDRPGTGLLYTAPWKLLTVPLDATLSGIEGGYGYSATIGPLFLALVPLLLLVWQKLPHQQRLWLKAALTFCGVLYVFWLWGVARSALLIQTRLLLPAFGIVALMAGAAVEGLRTLPRQPFDLGWLARAAIASVLALMLTETGLKLVRDRPLPVLVGYESRDDFLARRLGWYYPAMQYLSAELPPGSTVLFLWEPRSYHCQGAVKCWPDALLDRWLHATYLHGADAGAIAASWREQQVTHVLFHRAGYEAVCEARFDPITQADQNTLAILQRDHLKKVRDFGTAYTLYALQ